MKKFFLGLGLVALVIMVVLIFFAGQVRDFTCDIFNCTAFTNLVGLVTTIQNDIAGLGGASDCSVELARLEEKIDLLLKPEATLFFKDDAIPVLSGQQVEVQVWIHGETLREIAAIGFNLQYDDTMLQVDSVDRGPLLTDWMGFDFNETTPGVVVAGGYAGSGVLIVGPVVGHLCTIRVTAIGTAGQSAGIMVTNFVDDLDGFQPEAVAIVVNIQ